MVVSALVVGRPLEEAHLPRTALAVVEDLLCPLAGLAVHRDLAGHSRVVVVEEEGEAVRRSFRVGSILDEVGDESCFLHLGFFFLLLQHWVHMVFAY